MYCGEVTQKKQLGIVTSRYNVVQPVEIIQLYKDIASSEGWDITTVGSLDDGKRIWALAKTDASIVVGGEKINTHLLLSTTYDGKSSTTGKFLAVKELDSTTIPMLIGKNSSIGKVAVLHKTTFDADEIHRKLEVYKKVTKTFEDQANTLLKHKTTDDQALRTILNVLERKRAKIDDLSTRQTNIVTKVLTDYQGNKNTGTAWGLLSSLVHHFDYDVGISDNNRIRAAWFGLSETLKLKTMNNLLNV